MKRILLVAMFGMVACGRVASDEPSQGSGSAGGPKLYEADVTVLEDSTHGPELCLGGVADSLPPQCGGVPITNWDWGRVDGEESMNGAHWGEFHVVGSYDGERFTVTEVDRYRRPRGGDSDLSTPCPEPEGGWSAHDPARTSEADRALAMRWAESQPEHAGTWVQTTDGEGVRVVDETMVLIVAVTDDLERFEAGLRERWGGPVCVVQHAHTLSDLTRIQRELTEDPPFGLDVTWAAVDVVGNRVELGVVVADEEARAAVAKRYGDDAVILFAELRPVG